jgi:hypothetical protein
MLYYRDTLGSSYAILWGYPWVHIYCTMGVLLDPHMLYYGGALGSSYAILWGYAEVLIGYTMGVLLDPHMIYYGGTLRSSYAILWRYPFNTDSESDICFELNRSFLFDICLKKSQCVKTAFRTQIAYISEMISNSEVS